MFYLSFILGSKATSKAKATLTFLNKTNLREKQILFLPHFGNKPLKVANLNSFFLYFFLFINYLFTYLLGIQAIPDPQVKIKNTYIFILFGNMRLEAHITPSCILRNAHSFRQCDRKHAKG